MPELMISPTPTPPASGTGNTHALSQSDAAGRSGESPKTDTESGTESPFAAVLKSKMDKKTATTDTADSASSSTAAIQAIQSDVDKTVASIDLSALLPLMGANPAGTAGGMAAVPLAAMEQATAAPDERPLPGLQPVTELAPTQVLAALPSTATAVMDTGSRKQSAQTAEPRGQTFISADPARPDGTGQAPGKIALEAAINADVGHKHGESNTAEIPGDDFHALMERAAAMTVGPARPSSSISSPSLQIDTPLGQNGWHDEVGQKLTWMAGSNRQQADLVLTPPHLGRIEVSLTMNGDQATAIFTSSNPAVREALESSLQRLREVLADAGVSLGQAQVGSESPHQSSRQYEPDFGVKQSVVYGSTVPLPGVTSVAGMSAGRSMIDIFA